MKKLSVLMVFVFLAGCIMTASAFSEDKVLFGFENSAEGWEIPEWALEKDDHVAQSIKESKGVSIEGRGSLKIMANFTGGVWTAIIVEIAEYFDWSDYSSVSCDIYLPKSAPEGLKAKMIATVGEEWVFIEMARGTALVPGEWTTITAGLTDGSKDWRKVIVDAAFRGDIRKLSVRVESDRKPEYEGALYLDNVRVSK